MSDFRRKLKKKVFHTEVKKGWSLFIGDGLRQNFVWGDGVVFRGDGTPPPRINSSTECKHCIDIFDRFQSAVAISTIILFEFKTEILNLFKSFAI